MPDLKNIIGIGESNFKELIENGYLYIDKTAYLKDLVSSGTKVLFMLRPPPFRKNTYHEHDSLFSGNELQKS